MKRSIPSIFKFKQAPKRKKEGKPLKNDLAHQKL